MSHETVNFPYMVNGVAFSLPVVMVGGRVAARPVVEAMGLRWDRLKTEIARAYPLQQDKVDGRTQATLSMEDMEKWLAALPLKKVTDVERVKHFQAHLVPTLRNGSLGLAAEIAKQRAKDEAENARKASLISEICEPMESPDYMRKDLSLGAKRLAPVAIDYAVKTGVLDLFVRDASFWGDGPGVVRHMQVSPDAYREKLLGDMRLAHAELMTGPEAVASALRLPALERKTIPATKIVTVQNGTNKIVTVPAHPAIFPWERAILQGTKNAKDIELPGSPYHRQRPAWVDL